ncbi:TetR/AcrR family transcriptional regulator [Amycolatopsis cihanbeyliensis]|uniref:TetR family transcriptional regulator n=1 Tax=Amycolatopsis cihanbeyliensis TaxID=1128664 RepID=A0A542DLT9_AMYCI|nr:TetR/AcrR family transcriptional regulator [Amycolatopsis cihanbeyliensis]TQJ03945.1 TetR family transcriptional regulator [Amycolatopsis cihanbeyliensis]
MARTTPGVTRERILDEAVRLFAGRGYDATSVVDIQVACGLAPGSGALYKHFRSKRELLEHAVRRNMETLARSQAEAMTEVPTEPRAALRLLAEVVWRVLDDERELVRIMVREFAGFPELFEQMWQAVLANVYRVGAGWIEGLRDRGQVEVADPEATAAVLLSSLTYYPILDTLIGHTPGDLGRERFLAAWLEHAAATLGLP